MRTVRTNATAAQPGHRLVKPQSDAWLREDPNLWPLLVPLNKAVNPINTNWHSPATAAKAKGFEVIHAWVSERKELEHIKKHNKTIMDSNYDIEYDLEDNDEPLIECFFLTFVAVHKPVKGVPQRRSYPGKRRPDYMSNLYVLTYLDLLDGSEERDAVGHGAAGSPSAVVPHQPSTARPVQPVKSLPLPLLDGSPETSLKAAPLISRQSLQTWGPSDWRELQGRFYVLDSYYGAQAEEAGNKPVVKG